MWIVYSGDQDGNEKLLLHIIIMLLSSSFIVLFSLYKCISCNFPNQLVPVLSPLSRLQIEINSIPFP